MRRDSRPRCPPRRRRTCPQELHDGRALADGVAEEEGLDGGGADGAEERDGEEEAAEPHRLAGEAGADVVVEDDLSLVLEQLHGGHVAQTLGLWKGETACLFISVLWLGRRLES